MKHRTTSQRPLPHLRLDSIRIVGTRRKLISDSGLLVDLHTHKERLQPILPRLKLVAVVFVDRLDVRESLRQLQAAAILPVLR